MKKLLAKTKVAEVTDFGQNNKRTRLTRPDGTSEENKTFSAFTPQISVEILVNNPDAVDFFQAGEEVYLTFSKEPNNPDELNQALGLLEGCLSVLHNPGFYVKGASSSKYSPHNLKTCVEWLLTKHGVKTFATDDGNVVGMAFLRGQLSHQELMHFEACEIGEEVKRDFKGATYTATRLS